MEDNANPTKPKSVLCVEDEQFISELYTRALQKAGYTTKVVVRGDDGLAEAATDKYDIILLDLMLPQMTGMDILRKLRETPPQPIHSKIIVATNLDLREDLRAELEQLADGYVIKAELTPRQLTEFLDNIRI